MKANVFLRRKGLNCSFKLVGSDFKGSLLELLNEYSKESKPDVSEEKQNDNQQTHVLICVHNKDCNHQYYNESDNVFCNLGTFCPYKQKYV